SCGRRNLLVVTDRFDACRRVQATRELTNMEVVATPPSSEHRLAIAKQIIGGAQARLVEQRSCRVATQGDRAIHGMPLVSAEGGCTGTRGATAGVVGV